MKISGSASAAAPKAGGAKRPGKSLWERMRSHSELYILFLPILVYYVLIRYWPIALSLIVAFKDLKLGAGVFSSKWVGFDNFRYIFTDPDLLRVLGNTVEISLLRLFVGFLPPIFLAIMFHDMRSFKFKKLTQTLVYIPHYFSWVVVYGMIFMLFSTGFGLVNTVLAWAGMDKIEFLMSKEWFRPLLIGSALWKSLGWSTIIYLAALSGVDPCLYEAAVIDGCGPLRRVIHISFPSILPVVTFVLCINLGFILFAGGEQVLLFYNNAVLDVADIIDTWVYRVGLGRMQFSVGTAMGLMQSLIGMVMIITSNYAAKRYTGRGIW